MVVGNWLRLARPAASTRGWFLRLCSGRRRSASSRCIAGWITTEVGRQPWTVYGLLRTADSVSPSLTGGDVLLSLLGYVVAYS